MVEQPREPTDGGSAAPGIEAPSPALAPPPGNPRFPLIDALRGLAVLSVFTFHVFELSGRVGFSLDGRIAEVLGALGPTLFFVISGFLLYRPYVSARVGGHPLPASGRYARRRALRVAPGYWVALTVLAIFPGLSGVFTGDWWRYYSYLSVYSSHTQSGGIAVAWTLCTEVAFYVLLPFWAAGVRRLAAVTGPTRLLVVEFVPLAFVGAGGVLVQLAAARHSVSPLLGSTLLGQCQWLAIGMALAVVSASALRRGRLGGLRRVVAERSGLCWALALAPLAGLVALIPSGGLFGVIALATGPEPASTTALRLGLEGLLVTVVVLPAIFGDPSRGLPGRLLRARWLVWLGVVSYSFYLYHLSIVELLALGHTDFFSASGLNLVGHVHTARTLILYVLSFAVTGVVATLSYRFVELPFLRHKETGPVTR